MCSRRRASNRLRYASPTWRLPSFWPFSHTSSSNGTIQSVPGTAMHLLQSGVDITVIALWLGHEDVQTTHVYLQADLAMKEKALNKLAPPQTKTARFKPCDEVLAFLASL